MKRFALALASILMTGMSVQAQPSAEDQFRALRQDIEAAQRDLWEAQSQAKTNEEVTALFMKGVERRQGFANRALELARSTSDEAVAVDALTWVAGQKLPQSSEQARLILIQHYKQSDRLVQACRDASEAVSLESLLCEQLLRAAMESPHRQVRGTASYCLAELLEGRARMVGFFRNDPEQAGKSFGGPPDDWKQFFERTPDDLNEEAEKLYEQVVERYADVPARRNGVLGEAAKNKMFAMQRLGVGDEAPEIEGEDIDGKRFKLSDYRGKVVVLTFSGNWCGPCRQFYPQERALVERMRGRPFALVSVNTDEGKETLRESIDSGEITWRCWRDGGTDGPITTRWSIESFPSIFVIDHKGVIRHQQISEGRLEEALDTLLKEAEAAKP